MMEAPMLVVAFGLFALAMNCAHAQSGGGECVMVFDYSLPALVALGLLGYLRFAHLNPECC
jgi:hypothetical protein